MINSLLEPTHANLHQWAGGPPRKTGVRREMNMRGGGGTLKDCLKGLSLLMLQMATAAGPTVGRYPTNLCCAVHAIAMGKDGQ